MMARNAKNTSGDRVMPDEVLGRLIGEIHRLWRTRLNDLLRPLGLSQARWMTLRVLSRGGTALRQHELARLLGIEPPTLVGILDGLARDGYIERRESTTDRRSKTVHLTALARRKIRQINAIAADLRHELTGDIGSRRLRAAIDVLGDIREKLDA